MRQVLFGLAENGLVIGERRVAADGQFARRVKADEGDRVRPVPLDQPVGTRDEVSEHDEL